MYTARVENSRGELLTLTGDEPVYQLINIEGLNPPQAQINTTTIVGMDGTMYNSAKLDTRNIVLTVVINGEAEKNRLRLYSYFKTKEHCTFYFSNDSLDVSTEGYVESVECNMFSDHLIAQISIICLFPYFQGLSQIVEDTSSAEALFTFPFSIEIDEPIPISNYIEGEGAVVLNSGESDTGCEILITVDDAFDDLRIINTNTGEFFEVAYSFQAGDTIIINTSKGKKSINLVRDGAISNIFPHMIQGSTFFQLAPGLNTFAVLIDGAEDDGTVEIVFRYYNLYRGV